MTRVQYTSFSCFENITCLQFETQETIPTLDTIVIVNSEHTINKERSGYQNIFKMKQ